MRLFVLTCISLCFGALTLRAQTEAELFAAAAAALTNRFHERAEQQFGEFLQKFPQSTNISAAILYQAQARLLQRKYDGALELLRAGTPKAGALADHFRFWEGEALSGKGDFPAASASYAKVLQEFPQSPLALQASYLQANSEFQQKNFTNTVALLRNPEGFFQRIAKTNSQDSWVMRGQLLLAEALLALNLLDEARAAVTTIPAGSSLAWDRYQLAARIEFAGPKPEAALLHLTNAVSAAAQRANLLAQSWNLEAETYRKLNQVEAAVTAYERISSATNLAPDQRRLAVLKSVELLSATGQLTNAIARIETYLAGNTNESSADLLRLKAGELWVERFRASPAETNALAQARAHLGAIISQFTNSVYVGRAWLNLGWSYWEEGTRANDLSRIRESEAAFRNAAETLTRSQEQALAIHKIGDARLQLGEPQSAATNYLAVLRNFAEFPEVRAALFDMTYRQLVRAYIETGDLPTAEKILQEYRQGFSNGGNFEETLYLYGRSLAREGRTAQARAVFQDFLKSYPGSAFVPQVRYSESRSHAAEGNLKLAIKQQEDWLAAFTNHTLRAEVEFQRALLYDQDGQRTNSLRLLTNFLAVFPTHPLAPAAQNWVADYYYEQEQWLPAEQHYQRLFQNTNWTSSRFHFPARMMAARSAFFRQGYDDARSYLTNIIQDPKCPPELLPEAWFALGDIFIEQPIVGNTNAVANFVEAAKVFHRIVTQFPTNRITPLALARKGDCHANLATTYPESFEEAMKSYRAVLSLQPSVVPVSARNQAEVGLALLIKKSAENKPADEQQKLLRQALDHLLNVVYGTHLNGESPDPFYLKKAGLEAGRIAESLGDTAAAMELYRKLIQQAPSMRTFWEGRLASLQQRVAANSALN
jgi:TolA-binding protein